MPPLLSYSRRALLRDSVATVDATLPTARSNLYSRRVLHISSDASTALGGGIVNRLLSFRRFILQVQRSSWVMTSNSCNASLACAVRCCSFSASSSSLSSFPSHIDKSASCSNRTPTTTTTTVVSSPLGASTPAEKHGETGASAEEAALLDHFYAYSPPARLAALCVARYCAANPQQSDLMPLHAFMEKVPSVTRDAMRASQCDAQTWVKRHARGLLEVLSSQTDEGGVSSSHDVTHMSVLKVQLVIALPAQLLRAVSDDVHATDVKEPSSGAKRRVDFPSFSHSSLSSSFPCDGERSRLREELEDPEDSAMSGSVEEMTVDLLESALTEHEQWTGFRYMTMREAHTVVMRTAGGFKEGTPVRESIAGKLRFEQFAAIVIAATLGQEGSCNTVASTTTSLDAGGVSEDAVHSDAQDVAVADGDINGNHRFWTLHDSFVAARHTGESCAPPFVNPQPRVTSATFANNFGGWGSSSVVPTCEDVHEILKYVPVNWGNIGSLNIPAAVRRKHMRSGSTLMWFRRQPWYFEVRDIAGTIEVRRSIVLNPEIHGLTPEQAREQLELRTARREANHLIPLSADGEMLDTSMTAEEKQYRKFFYRVCPPYFAPLSLVMQRYTKKNLTEEMLLHIAESEPGDFEVLRPRFTNTVLVRRRAGADSSRWRDVFVADLERYPEDVRGIVAVMDRLCPAWDRPEYVYVRLPPAEQRAIGGYEGLLRVLGRHPTIFRRGSTFVCRVDSSDLLAQQAAEPAVDDMTSRTYLREETPYLSPLDIALVFHYVAPAEEPCTVSFLVKCSSPAMRVALPPRVITICQAFPALFSCKETAPGVFSIRKVVKTQKKRHSSAERAVVGDGTGTSAAVKDSVEEDAGEEDDSWKEEEDALAQEQLTRAEVISAVLMLVPEDGVDCATLMLWASMETQRAASQYFGGIQKMVEMEKNSFTVVEGERGKMVYKAGSKRKSAAPV